MTTDELVEELGTSLDRMTSAVSDVRLALKPSPPTPTQTVFRPMTGAELQKAIDAAAVDTSGLTVRILLAPKTDYRGNYQIPVKTHGQRIDVEPDWDSAAILGAGRVDPANRDLPRLLPASTTLPVVTNAASRGWHWRGVRVMPTGPTYAQIALGSTTATDMASVAADNHFLQCVLEADPVTFQRQGIRANCGLVSVRLSQLLGHGAVGADGQCFIAYNGAGPFLIEGNVLEGAGENVMFGGGRCMSEAMVPSDIVVRGNWVRKNLNWLTLASKPAVKNLFEIKNGQRWLVEENLFERNWTAGQAGGAILLKAANSGEPVALVRNRVGVFRFNAVRQAGGFLTINYTEAGPTLGCEDIEISDNVAYALGAAPYTGDGHSFRLGGGPDNIRLLHNTVLNGDSFLKLWDQPAVKSLLGLRVVGNVGREGGYGVWGQDAGGLGKIALDAYAPGYQWAANVLEDNGSSSITYPAGTAVMPKGSLASIDDPYVQTDAAGVRVGADVAQLRTRLQAWGMTL